MVCVKFEFIVIISLFEVDSSADIDLFRLVLMSIMNLEWTYIWSNWNNNWTAVACVKIDSLMSFNSSEK